MSAQHDVQSIASHFRLTGRLLSTVPFGSGHINDTYRLLCEEDGRPKSYILQRINHEVFRKPPEMMENIRRVTQHIRRKLESDNSDLAHRQLTLVPTEEGANFFRDAHGNYWRIYNWIEGALTYDTLDSPELAREAARMFGWFQRMLTDLPGPPLHETIANFHNTPKRLDDFRDMLRRDPCNRAVDAGPEIDFVLHNADMCDALLTLADDGQIPVRTTHNDTKINNVMMDKETHRGVCVIDLDTVMPGLSLYDFGDMVRTATNPAGEDEQNLSKVAMRISVFKQLVEGFACETHGFLTPAEKQRLALSARLITFEQMIRFLGDYLAGDVYYKTQRPNQNLDRSRTQMKMVKSIVQQEDAMNAIVERTFRRLS